MEVEVKKEGEGEREGEREREREGGVPFTPLSDANFDAALSPSATSSLATSSLLADLVKRAKRERGRERERWAKRAERALAS